MNNVFFDMKNDLLKKRIIDKNDKIIRFPKKQKDRHLILQYITSKFKTEIFYSEKDVNQIIKDSVLFDDFALIRRELIEKHYLSRNADCKKYRVEKRLNV